MMHYGPGVFVMIDEDGNKYKLEVKYETSPEDPRDWDNTATLVCWHSRYSLGDENPFATRNEFWSYIKDNGGEENFLIVPLYLMDHSGISISTSDFGDPWDSGQVGYAYISKEYAMKNLVNYKLDENGNPIKIEYKHDGYPSTYGYAWEPLTEETWKQRCREVIESEVETYDQYLTGDAYGYILTKKEYIHNETRCPHCGEIISEEDYEDWVEVDSCWGFYGIDIDKNGIVDNLPRGLKFLGE